jgi:hypothetical protein
MTVIVGIKSIAAVAVAGGAVAIAWRGGDLTLEHLGHLSASSAFAVGLFAATGAALAGVGWQSRRASRAGIGLDGAVPSLVTDAPAGAMRELPSPVQRVLVALAFACIGAGTFTNEATARIASVPSALTEPSRAEYCPQPGARAKEVEPEAEDDEPPPPPLVDQSGCALVKRAYELGYTKDLGTCAPQAAQPRKRKVTVATPVEEACERRQRDEPFAHFAWRRVVETASGASPADTVGDRIAELRTRVDYAGDLLADVEHSVTGTPHASHHLFVNLPDPHPHGLAQYVTGHVPCSTRYADLPLWPRWREDTPPALVVEHVFGQLLFATRFGTTASCSDYTIHWGAPVDACTRLAANPAGFLDGAGALRPMRDVLDRRTRQRALREMAYELGHEPTMPEPPPARAVVSASCFVVDAALAPGAAAVVSGREITLDGEPVAVRELRTPAIRAAGAGPVDVYRELALLLGGRAYAGPASGDDARLTPAASADPVGDLRDGRHRLLALEPLVGADPFLSAAAGGERAALERADVVDVYPFEQHLKAFVDAFRRVYMPQRGRL